VGGIMRNNGRYTATEEATAMGAGGLFALTDRYSLHQGLEFPGHRHASLYDVARLEPAVRRVLELAEVDLRLETRVVDVVGERPRLQGAVTAGGETINARALVDATGTAGPMGNCYRHGHGCALCVFRCPAFGPRVSLAGRAGVDELAAVKQPGRLGAISGSCKLARESLSPMLLRVLERDGVVRIALPPELRSPGKLGTKACQQYALPAYADNVVLLHTGDAKLMTPFLPLEKLRRIPGLENAVYTDPKAGGRGNSIRFLALTPHDRYLRVEGFENLFCAGEKAGVLVGHTEAIVTGSLAGLNAFHTARGDEPVTIPDTLATGDFVAHTTRLFGTHEGQTQSFTFAGSVFFERMLQAGQYLTDRAAIFQRVEAAGATGLFPG
jgi:hypothetical protein